MERRFVSALREMSDGWKVVERCGEWERREWK